MWENSIILSIITQNSCNIFFVPWTIRPFLGYQSSFFPWNQWAKLFNQKNLTGVNLVIGDELAEMGGGKSTNKDESTEVKQTVLTENIKLERWKSYCSLSKELLGAPKLHSSWEYFPSTAGYLKTIGMLGPRGLWRSWFLVERGRLRGWGGTYRHKERGEGKGLWISYILTHQAWTNTVVTDRHSGMRLIPRKFN